MKIQQKRNKTIHADLSQAKKYLQEYVTTNKATIKDGEVLYTCYHGGGDISDDRVYTLRGLVDATNPSSPVVHFDDVNNDNIVRENLLYYSYSLVGSGGYFKPFEYFESTITRGSQIRSDRAFTFSFELLPHYYLSTSDNKKVYFEVKNKTTNQIIPIKLVNKGYSYITQDDSRILFTIKESECKYKERLSVTFTIDDIKSHTSYENVVVFKMYAAVRDQTIKYMRNPKLELGYQMTDYCENISMKENYLYNKSIQYTKDVATSINNNIKDLHTPKYNYNEIEVSFLKTYLNGKYSDVFTFINATYVNVASTNTDGSGRIVDITNTNSGGLSVTNQKPYVVPALRVKGYNEDKLYLNGYGVDILYYKLNNVSLNNEITAIQTNKTRQCVLTKVSTSGDYSEYRFIDDSITSTSGSTPLICIPVDILYNTNLTNRPFMTDPSGNLMYPKIGENGDYSIKKLYFVSGTKTITPLPVNPTPPPIKPIDWNPIPVDDPETPWKEGLEIGGHEHP